MDGSDLKGRRALVTGASSGLGVEFARQLAERGADVVITARRVENLEALAKELREKHKVTVTVVGLDLSEPGSADALVAQTEGAGLPCDVLINNAGGGLHRDFVDMTPEQIRRQIQLNVVSLTELTWHFARAMKERGVGFILNVSSVGAYTPTPSMATYSAGKAYVRDFSEAVAYELADTPVRVCSLCPGGTVTEFHLAAGVAVPEAYRFAFESARDCARTGLDALFAGRRNIVSGWMNSAAMWLLRFTPRRVMVWSAGATMGRPKSH